MPGPYVIPLRPGDIVTSDVIPVPDQYVGAGSAQAAAKLSAMFARRNMVSDVRVGNEFSIQELRNHPAVLIGAFSNDWTMQLTRRLPLAFVQNGTARGIVEQTGGGKAWWLRSLGEGGKTAEDYALVSRVFD